jgi:hypothetical protein
MEQEDGKLYPFVCSFATEIIYKIKYKKISQL